MNIRAYILKFCLTEQNLDYTNTLQSKLIWIIWVLLYFTMFEKNLYSELNSVIMTISCRSRRDKTGAILEMLFIAIAVILLYLFINCKIPTGYQFTARQ